MLIVVANVYIKEGKQAQFLESAKKCVEATLKESGNVSYELNANAFDNTRFTFIEEWESNEVLNEHMETAHFKAFGAEITPILAKELDIKVYDANKLN